jgi:hypothetical protein
MDPQSRALGLPHVSPFVEQVEPTGGQGAPASSVRGHEGRGPTPQAGRAGPTGSGHTGQPQVLYQRRAPESTGVPPSSRTRHAWPNAGHEFTFMQVGVQYASKPGQQSSFDGQVFPLQFTPPLPELAPELGAPEKLPEWGVPELVPEPGAPVDVPEPTEPEELPEAGTPEDVPELAVPELAPEPGAPEDVPELTEPEELPEALVPEAPPESLVPEELPEPVTEMPASERSKAPPLQP